MEANVDFIRDAIAKILAEDEEKPHLIGDITLIAEMIGPDSKTYLFHLTSTEITVWKERGMLMYRLDMLSGAATKTEIDREDD